MKKLFTMMALVILTTLSFAQQSSMLENSKIATQKGVYFVGVNSTNLGFTNVDDTTTFNVGLTGGAFATQGLAVVAKVGYSSVHLDKFEVNSNQWSYGAGLRYYVSNVIPVQVDWTGTTGTGVENKSWVGFQGGYAFFVYPNFSIEPTVRYDLSTRSTDPNVWSGGVGFNLFF